MATKSIKINDLVNSQVIVSVARECNLCGTSFTTGIRSGETICPKCKELWKKFIESREVR